MVAKARLLSRYKRLVIGLSCHKICKKMPMKTAKTANSKLGGKGTETCQEPNKGTNKRTIAKDPGDLPGNPEEHPNGNSDVQIAVVAHHEKNSAKLHSRNRM
jgi:hypothetical protein